MGDLVFIVFDAGNPEEEKYLMMLIYKTLSPDVWEKANIERRDMAFRHQGCGMLATISAKLQHEKICTMFFFLTQLSLPSHTVVAVFFFKQKTAYEIHTHVYTEDH